jgi:peptidoglycan/LPS O-acetylase OafA/YrhL
MPDDLVAVEPAPSALVRTSQSFNEADSHGLYLRTKNFSALNGVRCLCCLAVIKEHVRWEIPGPRLLSVGWLGVDLFFVISGFLIVTLLIRERERRGTVSLGKFYARRSLRIFPIYYLLIFAVFFFYLAVSPWRPSGLSYYLLALPVLLTYTQDFIQAPLGSFNPCWSLAMEEQFYLFWPTVEKFAIRSLRWLVLGLMLALNLGMSIGLFNGVLTRIYGDTSPLEMSVYTITFTPILLGVLLAYLLHDRRSFERLYRVVGHRWSPFLFLALLFAIGEVAPDLTKGWARSLLHLNFMLLLSSLVVREDHYARPFLKLAPIARMGVISYGIYLYHMWIINLVKSGQNYLHLGTMNGFLMFIVVTAATVAIAEASYRFIEQPLLRIKKQFQS